MTRQKNTPSASDAKSRFTPPFNWSPALLTQNPLFIDLCRRFPLHQCQHWPGPALLNQWRSDKRFSFIENAQFADDGRYYEEYIYATAQIPTRAQNWHDIFGALIWCLFPKTKALLNQLHMAEIAVHGLKQRSKLRNKLTLFDECGIVLCLEPAAMQHAEALRNHQWQQSFINQRHDWGQGIRPLIFGHAIYEMATQPFIGLTAKAFFINVPSGFSNWCLTDAYSFIDNKLHEQIANGNVLLDNQQLTPLPVLGVPGWYNENETAGFYNNTDYFRPLRIR